MEVESITGCTLFYEESKTKDSKTGYPVCIFRLSNSGGCFNYKIPAMMFLLGLLVTYGYVQQNFAIKETVSVGLILLVLIIVLVGIASVSWSIEESLVTIGEVGVQLNQQKSWWRGNRSTFIPLQDIADVIINEAIHRGHMPRLKLLIRICHTIKSTLSIQDISSCL